MENKGKQMNATNKSNGKITIAEIVLISDQQVIFIFKYVVIHRCCFINIYTPAKQECKYLDDSKH